MTIWNLKKKKKSVYSPTPTNINKDFLRICLKKKCCLNLCCRKLSNYQASLKTCRIFGRDFESELTACATFCPMADKFVA